LRRGLVRLGKEVGVTRELRGAGLLELAREQKVGIRQDKINGTIEIELNLT